MPSSESLKKPTRLPNTDIGGHLKADNIAVLPASRGF